LLAELQRARILSAPQASARQQERARQLDLQVLEYGVFELSDANQTALADAVRALPDGDCVPRSGRVDACGDPAKSSASMPECPRVQLVRARGKLRFALAGRENGEAE